MTASPTPQPAPLVRSTFVTVLAWLGIILFGFSTLIGSVQTLMLQTAFRNTGLDRMMADSLATAPIPSGPKFLLGHFQMFFALIFACSVVGLVAFIGLLKRHNWARLTVVTLLGFGIAWNLFALALEQELFSAIPFTPPEGAGFPDMVGMFRIMRIFTAVMSLGFSALFGWLIARLLSKPIRAEFLRSVA